jgi:hypothetical protein
MVPVADMEIAMMIVAVVEVTEVVVTIALAVTTMTEIEDTVEAETATTMALVLIAMEDVMTADMIDVEVVAGTPTVTIVVETEMVVAPVTPLRQPNMVIPLLVQSLGNLMVAASLKIGTISVEIIDC